MTAATTAKVDLYSLIGGLHFESREGELPTDEHLSAAVDALEAVEEFLTGQIASAVIRRSASLHRDGSPTDEEIGRLLRWAERVRSAAAGAIDHAAQVAVLAHDDLQDDFLGDGVSPVVERPERYLQLRRRHGWGDPS